MSVNDTFYSVFAFLTHARVSGRPPCPPHAATVTAGFSRLPGVLSSRGHSAQSAASVQPPFTAPLSAPGVQIYGSASHSRQGLYAKKDARWETIVIMPYVLKMICNAFITLYGYTDEHTVLPVALLKVKG